ncbi:MAG: hypothetical protein AB7D57_14285 [Desulfovibrionaceae bacterium]
MKNIRIFLSFVVFIVMICAAVTLAPRLGEKLDRPFAAGLLEAPAIEHHAPAGHGEEHAPEGHGEEAAPAHG